MLLTRTILKHMKRTYGSRLLEQMIKLSCIAVVLLGLFTACRKESPDFPYAEIVSFNVVDANGNPLKGVIENNEIIIYWPPEQEIPERITPQIIVSDRASVQPASNTQVAFADGTNFTVTAQDGTTRSYSLKKIVNVPKPYITSFGGLTINNDKQFILVGGQLSFRGDYFNIAEGQLKVFLVKSNGQEVEIPLATNNSPVSVRAVPDVSAIGVYTAVRMESQPYSIITESDFEVIEDPRPSLTPLTEAIHLRRGQEYKLTGKNMEQVIGLGLNNENSNEYLNVDIIEALQSEITFRIPENFPIEAYQALQFEFEPNAYFSFNFISSSLGNTITITE